MFDETYGRNLFPLEPFYVSFEWRQTLRKIRFEFILEISEYHANSLLNIQTSQTGREKLSTGIYCAELNSNVF